MDLYVSTGKQTLTNQGAGFLCAAVKRSQVTSFNEIISKLQRPGSEERLHMNGFSSSVLIGKSSLKTDVINYHDTQIHFKSWRLHENI